MGDSWSQMYVWTDQGEHGGQGSGPADRVSKGALPKVPGLSSLLPCPHSTWYPVVLRPSPHPVHLRAMKADASRAERL